LDLVARNNTYGPIDILFEQAGLSTKNSFQMGLGATGLAWCATAFAWVLISFTTRRRIILVGLGMLIAILFTMGFLALAPASNHGAKWATAAMVFCFNLVYFPTTGATVFAIVGEASSIRLRSKTVALAIDAYTIVNLVVGIVFPYMINPTAGNWKGKIGFFWGGSCIFCFIWAFFRLPDMSDRTYEELDLLFASKVQARKFRAAEVNAYAEGEKVHLVDE
jgi:MFS transporter, SP family, general alpha glucoside:H+ symporter